MVAAQELTQLHEDQLAAFGEHAESLTQDALDKLAAIEQGYVEAYRAWMEARREWNVLARVNDLAPVPHPRLPEPATIFDGPAPRPPGVRPADDAERAVSQEPEPGTRRTWEHRDGRTMGARVGDQLDIQLAKDPDWQEVAA